MTRSAPHRHTDSAIAAIERRGSRSRGFLRALPLILGALLSAACSADEGVDRYLAEYVSVSGPGIDTTSIFPSPDAARYLINWPEAAGGDRNAIWFNRTRARIRIFAVTDTERPFVAEARPWSHQDAPPQTITLTLNETVLATREMDPDWRIYEFTLPSATLEPGWNTLRLEFGRLTRPADFDPSSNDRRRLAAQFRKLGIRPAGERLSPSSTGPGITLDYGDVRSDGAAGTPVAALDPPLDDPPDFSAAAIDMPADSMAEIFIVPNLDTELLGELAATSTGAEGDIRALIEIVDADTVTTIWEKSLSATSGSDESLHVELGEWAGRIVGLRIRVFGTTGAGGRWTGLRTRSSSASFDERLGIPEKAIGSPETRLFDQPDIFVVLLDTARADAILGDRGRDLAPNVQALAAEGTTFRQAWSPSAWTGQSVPALLTGMTPDTLGIDGWDARLPAGFHTFP